MKITKEELERLRKDPMARYMAKMMGVNLDKAISDYEKEVNDEKPINPFNHVKSVTDLDELVKKGVLTCEEKDGIKCYHGYIEVPTEPTKPEKKVEEDEESSPFLMNVEQLKKFVKNYRELIAAQKKLGYIYGIKFDEGESGFGFPSKANEIIWDLIRIIFGEENREDIADFVCGNSNFDSVESLYNELV